MNSDDSANESRDILKELRQHLLKYLAAYIGGLLLTIAAVFLQAYGDSIFDSIVHVLDKKRLLQIAALLLCSLGYCVYSIWKMNRQKLKWSRSLYWARGDAIPFCPHCHDTKKMHVHLNWKKYHEKEKQKDVEWWACYVCNHDFVAWHGESFRISKVNYRIS